MKVGLTVSSFAVVLGCFVASSAFAQESRSDAAFQATHRGAAPPTNLAGGTCPTPPIIASLPFTDSGDTCTSTNAITNYGGTCAANLPFPYPGPEVVYEINLAAGNNVAFSADLTGSAGDLALFLVGGPCGDTTNCVANSSDRIGAGIGPEVIDAASYPPGTYYLYVDSYYAVGNAESCGTYTLNISGTLPVQLQRFGID